MLIILILNFITNFIYKHFYYLIHSIDFKIAKKRDGFEQMEIIQLYKWL